MRKLIALLFLVLLIVSCKVKREYNAEYKVTYEVYYPNNTVTKTFTFKAVEGESSVSVYSFRGSNTLYVQSYKPKAFEKGSLDPGVTVESTTAPIQLISVERLK